MSAEKILEGLLSSRDLVSMGEAPEKVAVYAKSCGVQLDDGQAKKVSDIVCFYAKDVRQGDATERQAVCREAQMVLRARLRERGI